MNDRELLEKAAKAAGYVIDWSAWDYTGLGVEDDESETGRIMPTLNGSEWNPLTDDGDALRLAVKLHIKIAVSNKHAWAGAHCYKWPPSAATDENIYAATRRAIVRAAAAMAD